jgi:kumamolisin
VQLVLKLRNADQFQKCLDAITDPTSQYYGQFLNATTLEPYLSTPGQRGSMIRYLTQHGFNVTSGPSPIVLNVVGSVSVIQHVFGLKLGIYQRNSSFYAADSDPKMPQNLAALVNGITGLDNYTTIKPNESPCSGPFCPQGIQVGYSLQSLYNNNNNGAGQKVAIVDAPGDPNPCCGTFSALHVYDLQYGIQDPSTFQVFCGGGSTWTTCGSSVNYNAGWGSEAAMDIEAVHAVAPGAGILLFYGTSSNIGPVFDPLLDAIDYVAQNHMASIVSNSWTYACNNGSCSDTQLPLSTVSSTDQRLAFDAAQGLTILFASGDEGARPDGSLLGTEFPASDPNVLAVGATNLVLAGCGTSTCTGYASETGALISGGGYSGYFPEPSWQTSTIGVKSGSCAGGKCRAVPDVSMFGYSPSFWVYSTISSGVCSTSSGQAGWFGCAGTSLSTPLWAGFLAVALQMRGGGSFGNIGPKLYGLANSVAYSTAFHDITIGSNNGYSAILGWDPVTGWGSPIANVLASDLAQGRVSISLSPTSGGIGTSVSITGSNFLFTDTTCAVSSTPSNLLSGFICSITNGAVTASFTVASGVAAQSYTVSVTGSHGSDVASATFTVTSTQVTVTSNSTGSGFIVVDSAPITTPQTYTWVTGSTHTLAANSVVAGPTGIQYLWTSWSDGLSQSHSITVPSATKTYTANFKTQYQLTIALNPSAGGSTTPAVGSYWYDSGASQSVTATSAVGYSFYYWSFDGTSVGGTPTYVVTMNAPHTLTGFLRSLSTISISSPSSVALSLSVTISGTITPTHTPPGISAGNNLMLSYSFDSGATWNIFITTQTDNVGSYSVVWYPPYLGTYQLESSWGGNANYQGATSSTRTLTVTGTAQAPISMLVMGANSAGRGSSTSFNVLVTNPGSTMRTTLYLEIAGPGGYWYFDTQQISVTGGSTGEFQFDWQVPSTISTGSYGVNVGLIPPTSSSISQTQITIT